MKRAYLRKVKPSISSSDSVKDTVGQLEQGSRGVRRRARTSAAMVGLALSMGATGLVLPRQSGNAAAAEAAGTEASVSPVPQAAPSILEESNLDTAAALPASSEIQHKVAAGETLSGIAREYQVTVAAIAKVNKLSTRSVLQVGQVLKIPVQATAKLVDIAPSTSEKAADDSLRAERNQSLSRLRTQRQQLESKLLALRPESRIESSQENASKVAQAPIAELPPVAAAQGVPSQAITAPQTASVPSLPQMTEPAASIAPQGNTVAQLPQPDWIRSSQGLMNPGQETVESAPSDNLMAFRPSVVNPVTQPTVPQAMIPQAASESVAYRVSPGDTVARIAAAHNVPQSLLISANRISDPNFIFVGQVLQVPGGQVAESQSPVGEATLQAKAPTIAEVQIPVAIETPVQAVQTVESSSSVAVPTVPASVTAESSITTPVLPQQVAVAPFSTVPAAPAAGNELTLPTTSREQVNSAEGIVNPFVQNLMSEIRTLRQQHQQRSTSPQEQSVQAVVAPAAPATIAAAASTGSTVINPQFQRRNEGAVTVSAPVSTPALTATPQSNQPQVVAAAPLGSQSYAPLLRPITGRMVSPDLPPLPGADNFLPNQRQVFDGYIWPARGLLTSGYGWRWGRMHRGIDIAADVGTPIYAAAEGVVEFAGWNSGGYGNMIEIRHADGSMTRYAHLNRISVRAGQQVEQSQTIGEMGTTGFSTGPHLHFEVHLAQGTVNPISFLPSR